MSPSRNHRRNIEGIVRKDRVSTGPQRPGLDPFSQGKSKSGLGLKPSSGAGLEATPRIKTKAPVAAAPAFNFDFSDETHDEPKRQKRRTSLNPRSQRRGKLKKAALAAVMVLFVAGGAMGYSVYRASRKIFKGNNKEAVALQKEVDVTKLKGEGDGRVNILLTGVGGEGHSGPYLTDTLLVASLDPFSKEVALVSVPRDLWVTIKNVGSSKINAVLPNSMDRNAGDLGEGMKSLQEVVSSTLDMPIHYYALVDFTGFKDAITTVGGVNVAVSERVYDTNIAWENKNNPLIADVGEQHMDGHKALLYARSRYGSARGDFDRTQRQRQVMVALKDKVFSLGTFSNPLKMTQLIGTAGEHVQTNLGVADLKRLYELVKGVNSNKITSIGLADPPQVLVKSASMNGASVVVPIAGVGNYSQIQAFLRSSLVDGFIKKEKARISVIDATGSASLGKSKIDELKQYGYNIVTTSEAPVISSATKIEEISKGKAPYTKKYLENRLKVVAQSASSSGASSQTVDFVITLGSNAVSQ